MYSEYRTRVQSDRNLDYAVIKVAEDNTVGFFREFQKNQKIDFRVDPFDLGKGRYFLVFYPNRLDNPGRH